MSFSQAESLVRSLVDSPISLKDYMACYLLFRFDSLLGIPLKKRASKNIHASPNFVCLYLNVQIEESSSTNNFLSNSNSILS
jgi:hypothetical protein